MCAGYLFQQDKQYDVTYDTGDKAIQCGRHVDIFKFWLMWKAKVRRRETDTQTYKNQANRNCHSVIIVNAVALHSMPFIVMIA